jgi:hypothetical protein
MAIGVGEPSSLAGFSSLLLFSISFSFLHFLLSSSLLNHFLITPSFLAAIYFSCFAFTFY